MHPRALNLTVCSRRLSRCRRASGNINSNSATGNGGCATQDLRLVRPTLIPSFDPSLKLLEVDDGHGNYNNLLLVCSEGGTTREDLLMAKHADYSAYPKTAIDRHVDDMPEVDEDYYGETPLMPHEEPSLMTKSGLEVDPGQKGRRTSLGFSISRVHTFVPPEPTEDDLKDPELEKFPDNRAAILNRIDTLKYELPIDNY